jgi:hypothetical protein
MRARARPVERQIDRLKITACQTYGRAGLLMLDRGFLLAA